MLTAEQAREKETQLKSQYDTTVAEIKRLKSRFTRARNVSPMERLSISLSICELEDTLIHIGKMMRVIWFVQQAHIINAQSQSE